MHRATTVDDYQQDQKNISWLLVSSDDDLGRLMSGVIALYLSGSLRNTCGALAGWWL